jgi:predicted nucleotidyltransferase
MDKSTIKKEVVKYLKKFNPERIGIFGSFARGEEKESSDVDILVSFKKTFGLLQLVRIERELSNIIGRKVDLVTEKALTNKKLKTYNFRDLQIIFE